MTSELDICQKQPSICLHQKCIDCHLLPICEKDENEYDPEKVRKYLESTHCPQCGFAFTAETTDGRRVCLICLLEDE